MRTTEIHSENSGLVYLCVLCASAVKNFALGSELLVEDRVVNYFFHNLDFDVVHLRSSRSTLRPLDQPPDLERIALRNGFDGSVCAIAYPAGHFELLRTLSH